MGHSAILQYRYPFPKNYTANDSLANIFGDTPASQGLLFQASSLAPPFWEPASEDAPAGTYMLTGFSGTYYPQRIPVPTPPIYLGTTLLTESASKAGMAVNQWFRDPYYLYVRTGVADPEGNPEHYPCYILNYKNCHVRAGAITGDNLLSPGLPATHERLLTTVNRVINHQGLEFSFVNRADGDQDFDATGTLYRGWYDEPQMTYEETDLIDFQLGTLDAGSYGFDAVVMKGRESSYGYCFWPPKRWGQGYFEPALSPTSGVWKEYVVSDISMSQGQLQACAAAKIGQICDERYLRIWTLPDYALKCGDFVRVNLTSSPYDGQYDMRILNKAFLSSLNADVMEPTLYDGYPGEY
jgi:hypothetical protein